MVEFKYKAHLLGIENSAAPCFQTDAEIGLVARDSRGEQPQLGQIEGGYGKIASAQEREQEILAAAIRVLKKARRRENGDITSLTQVIQLLERELDTSAARQMMDGRFVAERLSVIIDALAFHAGQLCNQPDSIHGVITLLSEIRSALVRPPRETHDEP